MRLWAAIIGGFFSLTTGVFAEEPVVRNPFRFLVDKIAPTAPKSSDDRVAPSPRPHPDTLRPKVTGIIYISPSEFYVIFDRQCIPTGGSYKEWKVVSANRDYVSLSSGARRINVPITPYRKGGDQ